MVEKNHPKKKHIFIGAIYKPLPVMGLWHCFSHIIINIYQPLDYVMIDYTILYYDRFLIYHYIYMIVCLYLKYMGMGQNPGT